MGFFDPVGRDGLRDAGKASSSQEYVVKRAASQAGTGLFSAARAALKESEEKGKK